MMFVMHFDYVSVLLNYIASAYVHADMYIRQRLKFKRD